MRLTLRKEKRKRTANKEPAPEQQAAHSSSSSTPFPVRDRERAFYTGEEEARNEERFSLLSLPKEFGRKKERRMKERRKTAIQEKLERR